MKANRQLINEVNQLQAFTLKFDKKLKVEGIPEQKRNRMVLQSLFEVLSTIETKEKRLNEDVMDVIGDLAKGAIGGSVAKLGKETLARWVLEKFDVDLKSFLGKLLVNAISEIEFSDLTGIFEEGGCEKLVSHLTTALERTGLDELADAILEAMGVEDTESGMGGFLKRRVVQMITSTDFAKNLADGIAAAICQADPSKLTQTMTKNISKIPDAKEELSKAGEGGESGGGGSSEGY